MKKKFLFLVCLLLVPALFLMSACEFIFSDDWIIFKYK